MNNIELCRRIVKNHQMERGVDATTARAITLVYDGINEENKAKFERLPLQKMAKIAWKLVTFHIPNNKPTE